MTMIPPTTVQGFSTRPTFPYLIPPYTNGVPFTYRDGMTFLRRMEAFAHYIDAELIPWIDKGFKDYIDAFNEALTDIRNYMEGQQAIIDNKIADFTEYAEAAQKALQDLYDKGSAEFKALLIEAHAAADAAAASAVDAKSDADRAEIARNTIIKILINASDYGVVGDGSDETDKLNAAIAAVPNGGTLMLPNATINVGGTLTSKQKSWTFDMEGATLVKTTPSARLMTFEGGWDDTVSLTSITTGTVTEAGVVQNTIVVTHNGTMPWERGDHVKLFSDDVTPGVRSGTGRTGQFVSVYSVEAGRTVFLGTIRDPLTTNPRMARIQNYGVTVKNGVLDVLDSALPTMTGEMIGLVSLIGPVVENVTIRRSPGQAVTFASCLGGRASNNTFNWMWNDGVTRFGYAINNNVSENLYISGNRFFQPRTGYTDSSSNPAIGSTNPQLFGRAYGDKVIGNHVDSATVSAYNTHAGGQGHMFVGNTAVNCSVLHGLRGREHSVVGARGVNVGWGVRIFSESTGSDSYGHNVSDVHVKGCASAVVELANNWGSADPAIGTRETKPNVIRNIYADNVTGQGFRITNASAHISNPTIRFANVLTEGYQLNLFSNAWIDGDDWFVDLRETSGVGATLFDTTATVGSTLEIDGLRVSSFNNFQDRVYRVFRTSSADPNAYVRVSNMVMDYPPKQMHDTLVSNAFIDWETLSRPGGNSAYTSFNSTTIANTDNVVEGCRTRKPTITFEVTTGSDATLATLPVPFVVGQRLTVINTSSSGGTLRIRNDAATRRTETISGADVVLAVGASMTLVALSTNSWRQV